MKETTIDLPEIDFKDVGRKVGERFADFADHFGSRLAASLEITTATLCAYRVVINTIGSIDDVHAVSRWNDYARELAQHDAKRARAIAKSFRPESASDIRRALRELKFEMIEGGYLLTRRQRKTLARAERSKKMSAVPGSRTAEARGRVVRDGPRRHLVHDRWNRSTRRRMMSDIVHGRT